MAPRETTLEGSVFLHLSGSQLGSSNPPFTQYQAQNAEEVPARGTPIGLTKRNLALDLSFSSERSPLSACMNKDATVPAPTLPIPPLHKENVMTPKMEHNRGQPVIGASRRDPIVFP